MSDLDTVKPVIDGLGFHFVGFMVFPRSGPPGALRRPQTNPQEIPDE